MREGPRPIPEKRFERIRNKNHVNSDRKGQSQSVPCNPNDSEVAMTAPKYDRTLTVRGAADYLGLAISTLNKLRCTGGGPSYFKLGRSVRYDPHDLDEWLAAHRVTNTSEATARMPMVGNRALINTVE